MSSTRHEFTYVKLPICVQLFFGDAPPKTSRFTLRSDHYGGFRSHVRTCSEEESGLAKLRIAKRRGAAEGTFRASSHSAMLASATTPPGFPLVWEGVPTANYTMVGYDAGMLNIQVNA